MRRRRIVHAITRLELGGAQENTLFCVAHHDRSRFEAGLVAGRGGILDGEARTIPDASVDLVGWLRHPVNPPWDLVAVARLAALRDRLEARLAQDEDASAEVGSPVFGTESQGEEDDADPRL